MATSTKGSPGGASGAAAYKVRKLGEVRRKFNALVDIVFAWQPLAGSGLVRNDSPSGRLLSAIPGGAGGGSRVQYAFGISLVTQPDNTKKIRVNYGEVYEQPGSTWGGPPTGMDFDSVYLADVSASLWLNIYFTVDADSGAPTVTSVLIESTDATSDGAALGILLGNTYTDDDGNLHIVPTNPGYIGFLYADGAYWWSLAAGE